MKFRLSLRGQLRQAIHLSTAAALFGTGAFIQVQAAEGDAATGTKPGKAVELKGVQVTGSRIRRVDVEGPTPVQTITSQQITASGYQSVQEVFDNLSLNVGGSLGQNQSFGFTPGASSVDLRGFGVGRTLVLLDGRRLPVYPIAAGGTDNFVDLSSIPTAIVDRIEILTTGGTAIYGSDAISGVINIITKKRLTGFIGSVRAGGTDDGGYGNFRGQLAYGFNTETDSVIFNGEFSHNDVLEATDRFYSRSDVVPGIPVRSAFSSFGNSFVDATTGAFTPDPNCGQPGSALGGAGILVGTRCRFDRAKFRELFPETTRSSLFGRFEHKFDFATLYLQSMYNNSQSTVRQEPFPYQSPLIDAAHSPTGRPGYFYRRSVEFGPRGANVNNVAYGFLTGLKGNFFNDYEWDVGLFHNQTTVNNNTHSIISSALNNFVCGGGVSAGGACTYSNGPASGFNLFNPIPDAAVLNASYERAQHSVSQNSGIDVTISGPVGLSLPGGAIQVSAFGTYDKEYYSDLSDPLTASNQGVDGGSSARGNRGHTASAIEFNLPLLHNLALDIAGRYDAYFQGPVVNDQVTEQAALSFRPIDRILLRSSIGSTFKAPELQRLYGGETRGFDSVLDSPRCKAQGGTLNDNIPAHDACNVQVQSVPTLTGGNLALKNERGTNYSFGFVVEPIDKLSLSADYFHIQLRQEINNVSSQDILDGCARDGQFCGNIHRTPDGKIGSQNSLIVSGPVNLSGRKQNGIDAKLDYQFKLAPVGKFDFRSTATYLTSYKKQLNVESVNRQQLGFGSQPRYRFSTVLDWSNGPFGLATTWNYVPKVPGLTIAGDQASRQTPGGIDEYLTHFSLVNLQGRYMFDKWGTFRVGVNNVLNSHPPYDHTDTNNQFTGGVASSYSNPIGREGYVQYEFKY